MWWNTRFLNDVALGSALIALAGSGVASAQIEGGEHAYAARLERSISFWQARIERNPDAYLEMTLLGEAIAEQARMENDIHLYRQAEETLRRALQSHPDYGRAKLTLSFVLVQLHGFDEAAALLEPIAAAGQLDLQSRAYLADVYLAVGRYDDAREMLGVEEVPPPAALVSRRAQLANIEGKSDDAIALMTAAREASGQSADPPSVRAWYEFQTGELYLHRGRLEDAERHYRAAMAFARHDPLPWLGMGEIAAARGKTADAIAWLRRAEAVAKDPEVLAILGDLHLANGDVEVAQSYYDQVESVCKADGVSRRMYRSFLANFYANRGRHLEEALSLALAELDLRHDIHSYETAAWALYKNGDYPRAMTMIERALRMGTQDAELLYRAGRIALAAGEPERGRRWLDDAASTNPYFNPPYNQRESAGGASSSIPAPFRRHLTRSRPTNHATIIDRRPAT